MNKNKDFCRLKEGENHTIGIPSSYRNWFFAIIIKNSEKSLSKKFIDLGYEVFFLSRRKYAFGKKIARRIVIESSFLI